MEETFFEPRVLTPENENHEEVNLEISLRPEKLTDFVGQEQIKKNLDISIQAAKKRNEPLEHILLYGNPGLGKTTLANIIAKEMGVNIKTATGPTLEKVGDLAAILSNMEDGEVLFIDEIHRLNKNIEEVLYPAMEDYSLNIIIGTGPAARTIKMPLNHFTLIGATTKTSMISGPLRDRFGHDFHLNFYEHSDIEKILSRNATILNTKMSDESLSLIATRARRTPRIANRLLKRARDYAEVYHEGIIHPEAAKEALNLLAIDNKGLDEVDRKILNTMIQKFNGGPVGLSTIAAATAEEMEAIETIYEPFLLQIGFIERTPRGRRATAAAYNHLGFEAPRLNTLI